MVKFGNSVISLPPLSFSKICQLPAAKRIQTGNECNRAGPLLLEPLMLCSSFGLKSNIRICLHIQRFGILEILRRTNIFWISLQHSNRPTHQHPNRTTNSIRPNSIRKTAVKFGPFSLSLLTKAYEKGIEKWVPNQQLAQLANPSNSPTPPTCQPLQCANPSNSLNPPVRRPLQFAIPPPYDMQLA